MLPVTKLRMSLLSTLLLVACGGGGDSAPNTSPPPPPPPTYQVSAIAVKGPLRQAQVELHRIDSTKSDYVGKLVDSGTTNDGAVWQSTKIENQGDDYYLLKLTSSESTIDINTGKTPVISPLWSLVSKQQLVSEKTLNITPATTLVTLLALSLQSNEGVSLYNALQTSSQTINDQLGFGLLTDIDVFTSPILLSSDPTQTADLVRHRVAVEALSALLVESANFAQRPVDSVIEAIISDLKDNNLNGTYLGEPVELFSSEPTLLEHIRTLPIRHLSLPGTDKDGDPATLDPYLVSETPALIADEQSELGTIFDVTSLMDGSITLSVTTLSEDFDLDGYPNGIDSDDDNDGVDDIADAFPLDPNETLDSDEDGIGDNVDAYPLDSGCSDLAKGNGSECYVTWLPKQSELQIAASASGSLFFYDSQHNNLIIYELNTATFSSSTINIIDTEKLNKIAYADDLNRLYLGFNNGRIAYFDVTDLQVKEFAVTTESVNGLAVVGKYLLAQDNSGAWESHYIFDSQGNQTDWREWNHFSNYYAWNQALERVYFFRDTSSPNDILFEEVDQQTGVIAADGDSPYHGDYSIRGPILISPDGTQVFLGAGNIYNAETLRYENSIGMQVDDAVWLDSSQLVVFKQSGGSVILTRFNADLLPIESTRLQGKLVKAIKQNDKAVIIINNQNQFEFIDYVPNDDLDADGVTNLEDAFPTDIAASLDSDNDGYPDHWNEGFTASDSTTGLIIDAFPADAACQLPEHSIGGACDIDSQINLTSADEPLVISQQLYALSTADAKIIRWNSDSQSFLNPILLRESELMGAPISMAVDVDGSYLVGYDAGSLYRYAADGIGLPVLVKNFSAAVQQVFVTTNHYLVVIGEGNYYRDYVLISPDGTVTDVYENGRYSNDYEFVADTQHFYWFANSYSDYLYRLSVDETTGDFTGDWSYRYAGAPTAFMSISADESLIVTGSGKVIQSAGSSPKTVDLPVGPTLSSEAKLLDFVWLSEVGIGHYSDEGRHTLTVYSKDLKQALVSIPWAQEIVSIVRNGDSILLIIQGDEGLQIEDYAIEGDEDADSIPLWWELAYGLSDQDAADSQVDSDQDSLTNLQEFQALTLPNNPDTDGDGLNDGTEVLELLLNPLLVDSDGDFMPDGWEFVNGLNGNDADDAITDADNDGVSNYHEYLLQTDPQDSESFPESVSNVLYSFEDSLVPVEWQISATPEFATKYAYKGAVSLALADNTTIEWNRLFNNSELNFYIFSDCYSSYNKQISIELDGEILLTQYVEQTGWQKLQLLISSGYHELKISVESSDNSCRFYLDAVSAAPMSNLFEMGTNTVGQKGDQLYLYDYDGGTLRSIAVPGALTSSDHARDIAVLDDGRVAIFNGTFSPILSYYTPQSNSWQHLNAPAWSTINNGSYGGIDAIGSRVITTNMATSGNSTAGFVVFNLDDESVKYVAAPDLIDLTVGLDGYIYGLSEYTVYKFHPDTYVQLDSVAIDSARAIAVGVDGNIYAATWGGEINQYNAAGTLVNTIDLNVSLMDISLRSTGEIIVSDRSGYVYSTTTSLVSYQKTITRGEFVDFVPNIDSDKDGIPDWWEAAFGLDGQDANDATADLDKDGLTAFEEYSIGTRENNADTDQDSLSDGQEYFTTGTNPLDADSDDDGLNDGQEIELGTDPWKVDTDGDGLSDSNEYNNLGTDPVVIDTDQDGMNDGYEVANNLNANEDDASFDPDLDGLSNIEEHDASTNPNLADTDGDSLNDYDEIYVYFSSPLMVDTDGDKLPDNWEVGYGFDVNEGSTGSLDTDSDLFTNLEEYYANSDPTDNMSLPTPIEWQTAQGNASHTGYTPHIFDEADFALKWQIAIGSVGTFNPVTASSTQVFASSDSYFGSQAIVALDAASGDIQWQLDYPDIHSINAPAFEQDRVYYQTGGHEDSFIRAVDVKTGDLMFESSYGNQWSRYLAPTLFDGSVYMAGGYYGGTYAFDADTGSQEWFFGGPQYDEFTPAVDENYVYAFTTQLYIFDRHTGEIFKSIEFPGFNWSGYSVEVATVLTPEKNVVVTQRGTLVVFDTKSGSILWQRLNAGFSGQPTVANGVIYAVANGSLYAIDELSGENIWIKGSHAYRSNIIMTKTHIFVGDGSSTYAIDVETTKEVWSYAAAGHLSLSLDGSLYIAGSGLTAISLK